MTSKELIKILKRFKDAIIIIDGKPITNASAQVDQFGQWKVKLESEKVLQNSEKVLQNSEKVLQNSEKVSG